MMLLQTVEPGRATGKVARVCATFDRVGKLPLPIATLRTMEWTDADLLDAVAHGANMIASAVLHKAFVRGLEEH